VRAYRIQVPGAASAPTRTRQATVARRRRIVSGVVVSLVVIAAAAAWWTSPRFFPGRRAIGTEAPRLSIVVLPFTNLSGDPNQDYFADGDRETKGACGMATKTFLSPPPETRLLLQTLADFCAELLREDAVGVDENRVVSYEDQQHHFDTLMKQFSLATELREKHPSFSSSIVVAVMAKLIYDRATVFDTRPSPRYQANRAILEKELQEAVSDEPGDVGIMRLQLVVKHRRIESLLRLRSGGELTFEGASSGAPVFQADNREVFRFSELVSPTHICDAPSPLAPRKRVTLTTMESNGDIAFTAGCPCNYLATGLELERDL